MKKVVTKKLGDGVTSFGTGKKKTFQFDARNYELKHKIGDPNCDYEVVFSDKVVKVHKIVLKKNNVLRAAVTSEFLEGSTDKWVVTEDDEVGFLILIKYLYGEQFTISLPESLATLSVAKLYT
ncbi:MAG: BTB/POZ domain-containing protein, partial [Nitrosopumilus sp.]|nr:BTB/POZ domain-containing protein [Nitrosopumilus sp.]